MNTVNLSLDSLQALAEAILVAHDTSATNAEQVATALVAAESDGQQGHGASRIPSYAAQAKSGKVDGHATPLLQPAGDAAVTIDAAHGFAYPALNLAFDALCELVPKCGIAAAAIGSDCVALALKVILKSSMTSDQLICLTSAATMKRGVTW